MAGHMDLAFHFAWSSESCNRGERGIRGGLVQIGPEFEAHPGPPIHFLRQANRGLIRTNRCRALARVPNMHPRVFAGFLDASKDSLTALKGPQNTRFMEFSSTKGPPGAFKGGRCVSLLFVAFLALHLLHRKPVTVGWLSRSRHQACVRRLVIGCVLKPVRVCSLSNAARQSIVPGVW